MLGRLASSLLLARRALVAMLLVWAATIQTGCAAPATTRDPDKQPPLWQAPLSPLDSRIPATSLWPPRSPEGMARVTHGRDRGEAFRWQTRAKSADVWLATQEGRQAVTIERNADGSLVIAQEEDLTEKVRVTYDPPLPLLPAMLEPDATMARTVQMRVENLGDGSLRDRGQCLVTVAPAGTMRVVTPAGTLDVIVVRSVRRISLSMASVVVTIDTAWAPGRGPVAEAVQQRIAVLGLLGSSKSQEWRIVP